MDGLFVLGGLVLAIPIAVIYLLISHARLKKEVRDLRSDIRAAQTPLADDQSPLSAQAVSAPAVEVAAKIEPNPWVAAAEVEQDTPNEAPPVPAPAAVFNRENFDKLTTWLGGNWFYVVSAISLALAGIFLVQYGAEAGLLPPVVRVIFALLFGVILIGAGEVIRRRFGDDVSTTTAYLPSVFSSAGIATLFAGILAARLLYDLIGPEAALFGMVLTALTALVLGWFYGPLLAAVGIIGAFASPFFVGGSSDDATWLYGYFAVVAALGLGIDTVRRWAWVTVITLVLAYAVSYPLLHSASAVAFGLYMAVLALLAILVPARGLKPDHAGLMVVEALAQLRKGERPGFATKVAFGSVFASSFGLFFTSAAGELEFWIAIAIATALSVQIIFWSSRAPALQDVAILPAIGFVAAVVVQGAERMAVKRAFDATYDTNPEAAFPLAVTLILLTGVVITGAALWRSLVSQGSQARFGLIWAAVAAYWATGTAIGLELFWQPDRIIGPYPWALHAAALAGLMVFYAERLARKDGPDDRLRMSFPVLSALSCLAFAFAILFTQSALTIALIVTVVVAAGLDRLFRMPLMTLFISIGVAVIGYRLVADPGLLLAINGPLSEVLLVYGGALAGLIGAIYLIAPLSRPTSKVVLDSAAWAIGGVLLSVLLMRWLISLDGASDDGHWAAGLYAVIWLGLMIAQLRRAELGGWLRYVRIALATVFGVLGFGLLLMALTLLNPLYVQWTGKVLGPPFLNTLAVAYLLPAVLLLTAALRIKHLAKPLRTGFLGVGGMLVALWVFMVIRHFWQGADNMLLSRGMTQPELYSYTVALLLVGGALFYQSLAKRSDLMRRAGLGVIMLAVAKVFFVDAGELTGLTRVFSFLFLGLALAGLAWLGRWAQRNTVPDD